MTFANLRLAGAVLALGAVSGCDYSGDWLFSQPIPGLPSVYQINSPDGGPLVPADVSTPEEIAEATIYGEVAASQTTELGGVTAEFIGTGGPVCVWVDPETVYWTQAIAENAEDKFTYPDNTWDDGDLDLRVGLSVYYTGSPDRLGDFVVTYEDDLGNPVEIQLQDCPNQESAEGDDLFVDAGQGSADRCTIERTEPGVSYTIVLRSWSTPIDDDRLGYGLLLTNGSCAALEDAAGQGGQGTEDQLTAAECVIFNEAIRPLDLGDDETEYQPVFGLSALEEIGGTYPSMQELERLYCTPGEPMRDFCRPEARQVAQDGLRCLWDGFETEDRAKCFCGDPNDTPENGPS